MIEPELPPIEEAPPPPEEEPIEAEHVARQRNIDPVVVYVILLIITLIGLSNLALDVRYSLLWSLLTLVGVLAIILDKVPVEALNLRSLLIGLGFGAIVGLPFMTIGAGQLHILSSDMFPTLPHSAVFQALVFTMPLAETLFFRAAFQAARGPILTGLASGIWAVALFFPALPVIHYPAVAVVLGLCLVFVNFLYSYVRHRSGLFASWVCQITLNLLLLFLVRFM